MRATRRNVLVILGVLTIAGGALFGTGAFTQVSAERTVTAETTGDGSAYLTLDANSSYASQSDDTVQVTIDELNENATSVFDGVIDAGVSTNAASGSYDLYVNGSQAGLGSGAVMDVRVDGEGSIVGSGNAVTLTEGDTVSLDFVFDTDTGDSSNLPDSITFVAES